VNGLKVSEWIGKIVDITTINGNYYKEVELVDVDEAMQGVFVKDSPEYSANIEPYFVSGIVEMYPVENGEPETTIGDKIQQEVKKTKKVSIFKQK
jgi:hypothetical protein